MCREHYYLVALFFERKNELIDSEVLRIKILRNNQDTHDQSLTIATVRMQLTVPVAFLFRPN